jgi:hypothetical protein
MVRHAESDHQYIQHVPLLLQIPYHSIEPTQFRSSKPPPPESGCGLMVTSRAIRQDQERVKLSSVEH